MTSLALPTVFSVIESPGHPDFSALYARLGIRQVRLGSIRKAISRLKQQPPELVVAEFFYGYGNNYAGVNVSNLDVLLSSLQRYAPRARVIVLVDQGEVRYVDKLKELFPVHAVLEQPVREPEMEPVLRRLLSA